MTTTLHRAAGLLAAVAAACALVACDRGDRSETARVARSVPAAPDPDMTIARNPTGSAGVAPHIPLPTADTEFVSRAAEDGLFDAEAARLAAEKASDPALRDFAQMLVEDRTVANDRLRQLATAHNLALEASLPDERKAEIDRLARLSGAEFDRVFVEQIGVRDLHRAILDFDRASHEARSDEVRSFARSTLPTLHKHLAAAGTLPNDKGKG